MLSASVPHDVKQTSSGEARAEKRLHRVQHLGANRGRSGVVEIDGFGHTPQR
jgi:hypothetical protein